MKMSKFKLLHIPRVTGGLHQRWGLMGTQHVNTHQLCHYWPTLLPLLHTWPLRGVGENRGRRIDFSGVFLNVCFIAIIKIGIYVYR